MNDYRISETDRRLENVLQIGIVEEADYSNATVRVRVGDIVSGALQIGTKRAGNDRDWAVYEVGEQVLIGCPSGDLSDGIVICAIYSDAFPAPRGRGDVRSVDFADGTRIIYDRAAHHMIINLGQGSAEIIANGGIKITGNIELTGKLTASDDVIANGISLKQHKHEKVRIGTNQSGGPI